MIASEVVKMTAYSADSNENLISTWVHEAKI